MFSITLEAPVVNPALTRPVASLAGAALYISDDGIARMQLVTGKGNGTRSKWYAVERITSDFGLAPP